MTSQYAPQESSHTLMSLEKTFKEVYTDLNAQNAESNLLDSLYEKDVMFIDPLHQVKGLKALKMYFKEMYSNLSHCAFRFHSSHFNTHEATIRWTLEFRHKRLSKGKLIQVMGISYLRMKNNKIVFHQDYYDAGALLYEQVPLIGVAIKFLKKRIQGMA